MYFFPFWCLTAILATRDTLYFSVANERETRLRLRTGRHRQEHRNKGLESGRAEDKFDLATDDANVDFSVSGIPEEAVKRSEN